MSWGPLLIRLPGEGWKDAAVSVPAAATALRFKAVTGEVRMVEGQQFAGIMGNNRGWIIKLYNYHGKNGYFIKHTQKMGCLGYQD